MKHDPFTLDTSGNAHGERDCLAWVRCKWVRTAYDPKNEFAYSVGNVRAEKLVVLDLGRSLSASSWMTGGSSSLIVECWLLKIPQCTWCMIGLSL
jgi:hypothetical protein